MFVSAAELPAEPLDADLLIVGTGPAGLILAHALMRRGLRIVLLESGELSLRRDIQMLCAADLAGAPTQPPTHSRYRVYGGSTTMWGGQCVPLEPIDFEERAGIPHSGWPFDHAHLAPYYARAGRVLGLDPRGFDPVAWAADGSDALPLAGSEITRSVICFARPLDIGAALRQEFAAATNVTIVLGAQALAIETGPELRVATGVRFADLSGTRRVATARQVVLAAGGIETPRLLLASTDHAPSGLGNAHDGVGRYFLDHPYLMPGWLAPATPDLGRGFHVIEDFASAAEDPGAHAAFTLDPAIRRREGLPGCTGYFIRRRAWQLRPSYTGRGGAALTYFAEIARGERVRDDRAAARAADLVLGAPSTVATLAGWTADGIRPQPRAALRICLEATPRADSRITLGTRRDQFGQPLPRIDWRLNALDWDALARFRVAFGQALAKGRAGRLVDDDRQDSDGYPVTMTGGRHHMGATRMHRDPRRGVVDADLKVHGMANLHLASTSVFPTGGWANPTFTLVALALRLADRLASR